MFSLRGCALALAILAGVSTGPSASAAALPRAAPSPQEETVYRPECPAGETSIRPAFQFAGPRKDSGDDEFACRET
jgi:hypothetical protein